MTTLNTFFTWMTTMLLTLQFRLKQTFYSRRSALATGNTSSNLGWLAIVLVLIIAAYIFWHSGPGHLWFDDILQAPTSITP